jgi:hypothetical protein
MPSLTCRSPSRRPRVVNCTKMLGRRTAPALANISQCDHDFRSHKYSNPRAHKQNNTNSDVNYITWRSVRIAPTAPNSDYPCCHSDKQKDGSGIDQRNNHEDHAAEPTCARTRIIPQRSVHRRGDKCCLFEGGAEGGESQFVSSTPALCSTMLSPLTSQRSS